MIHGATTEPFFWMWKNSLPLSQLTLALNFVSSKSSTQGVDLLINRISQCDNHYYLHSAASVMLEVVCGLAKYLLKSYREEFLLE